MTTCPLIHVVNVGGRFAGLTTANKLKRELGDRGVAGDVTIPAVVDRCIETSCQARADS